MCHSGCVVIPLFCLLSPFPLQHVFFPFLSSMLICSSISCVSAYCQHVVIPLIAISSMSSLLPLPHVYADIFPFLSILLHLSFFLFHCLFFLHLSFPIVTLSPCSLPGHYPSSHHFLTCHHNIFLSLSSPPLSFFLCFSAPISASSIHLSIHLFLSAIFSHT